MNELPKALPPDGLRSRRFKMARNVAALMLREMSTTYGRSPGGYIWAVMEPVLGLAFLVFIFSFFMRTPPLGNSFPLFYATGFLPFMAIMDVANKIATSIRYSKPLLEYPVVKYLDAMVARLLLVMFTHLVIAIIIIGFLIIFTVTGASLSAAKVFELIAMITLLGFAIGSINCFLMTAFPVWERLWQVITRPLALVSGIFFTYHDMPLDAQNILWYNPIMHVIGLMRDAVYPNYWSSYISVAYIFVVSCPLIIIGLSLLNRHHSKMMNEM